MKRIACNVMTSIVIGLLMLPVGGCKKQPECSDKIAQSYIKDKIEKEMLPVVVLAHIEENWVTNTNVTTLVESRIEEYKSSGLQGVAKGIVEEYESGTLKDPTAIKIVEDIKKKISETNGHLEDIITQSKDEKLYKTGCQANFVFTGQDKKNHKILVPYIIHLSDSGVLLFETDNTMIK